VDGVVVSAVVGFDGFVNSVDISDNVGFCVVVVSTIVGFDVEESSIDVICSTVVVSFSVVVLSLDDISEVVFLMSVVSGVLVVSDNADVDVVVIGFDVSVEMEGVDVEITM